MITLEHTHTQKLGRCYHRYHYKVKTTSVCSFFKEKPEYSWESQESVDEERKKVLNALKTLCGAGNSNNGTIESQKQLDDKTWEIHYSYEVDSGD